jgi:Domain of unknown function (DUF4082)/PEP-CTERM motif
MRHEGWGPRVAMKTLGELGGLALFAASCIAVAPAQGAVSLGVDFPAGANDLGPSEWNLGWSFTANTDVSVVGLGNWAGVSFPQDQQVGLWDSSGTLLARAFVSNSSSEVGSAPWLFSPITPVKLVAGQTYVVGGQGGAEYTGLIGDASADPRISFGIDLYSYVIGGANSPLVEPTNSEALGPNEDSWFGGNIELSTVPEPSTWAMMLLGFAGLGYASYRRARAGRATLAA